MPVKRNSDKTVFIIESDTFRQNEIKEALSHQTSWKIRFFDDPDSCIRSLDLKPMVIFLDIEHFSTRNSDPKAMSIVADLNQKAPNSAIIVFCDSEKEHEAAAALKNGALDYIVLNQHQYAKMESELTWIEGFLDQRNDDKRQKRFLLLMSLGMFIFIITLVLLDYLGIIHEGTNTDILIGE